MPVTVASHQDRARAERVAKLVYAPLSLATSAAAGLAAAKAVKMVRKDDADDRIGPVLVTAAVQGAVFAAVKAAADRAGTRMVEKAVVHLPEHLLPGADGKPHVEAKHLTGASSKSWAG